MAACWPRTVAAGAGILPHVEEMPEMRMRNFPDASHDDDDKNLLSLRTARRRLASDGFVLVRGAVPAHLVAAARAAAIARLTATNFINVSKENYHHDDDDDAPIPPQLQAPLSASEAHTPDGVSFRTAASPGLLAQQEWIAAEPALMAVLEHKRLRWLISGLLDAQGSESVATLPFKWLRAVGTGLYTGLHCDRVYMRTKKCMLTIWVPLGRVTPQMGALVVAAGSHRDPSWKSVRETYGQSRAGRDGTQSGWLCLDPNDAVNMLDPSSSTPSGQNNRHSNPNPIKWQSAEFEPGDVCILSLDVMHMSATNTTDSWRISCDTRWLPIP